MKMPSNLWKLFSLGSTPMTMKFLLVSLLVHAVAAQLPCELFTTSIGHDSIKIQVPEQSIESGQEVKVVLRFDQHLSAHQNVFVQAVGVGSREISGKFVAASGHLINLNENCGPMAKLESVAESNELIWTHPIGYEGPVTFRVIVLDSTTVISSGRSMVIDILTPVKAAEVYDGCGINKGCYGSPVGCLENRNCDMMTTYARNESEFIFEIFGRNKPNLTNYYTAVGFSDNQRMGDDCVVECVLFKSQVKTFMSVNVGEQNIRDASITVQVLETRYENDTIYCHFKLKEILIVKNFTCNLNESQYLLLATGPALITHAIREHTHEVASDEKINLNSIGSNDGATSDILAKLHGSFMIVAWIIFAPVGVICARYFKPKLKRNVCGKDLWFTIHRTSMIITWLLTLTAFVMIFIQVDGWSSQTAHAVIGCIVTFLVFIQPIMAAFRPLPASPKRPLFNWSHFLVGNSAHILSVTCIFLALDITHVEASDWTLYLLIAFVIIYCCTHAAMTITDVLAVKRQDKKIKNQSEKPKKFKKWIAALTAFTVIVVAISAALIVGIQVD